MVGEERRLWEPRKGSDRQWEGEEGSTGRYSGIDNVVFMGLRCVNYQERTANCLTSVLILWCQKWLDDQVTPYLYVSHLIVTLFY